MLQKRATVAVLNIELLGSAFDGKIPGNRREILSISPAKDSPKCGSIFSKAKA
jgi:hypothetical protein